MNPFSKTFDIPGTFTNFDASIPPVQDSTVEILIF